MTPSETARQLTAGHVFAAPPIATAAAAIGGLALSEWVYVIAILSGLVSIGYTIWRWVRDWRAVRGSIKPTVPPDR